MAKLRHQLIRKIFSGPKGRHYHWRALGPEVTAIQRDCGDHVVTFDPKDIIGRHLYTFGHWQRDAFDQVIALLQQEDVLVPGKTVLEFGANIGTQTLYMHLSGLFGQVIAVEADPGTATLLARNMEDNALTDKTQVVVKAIGAEDGTATFYQSGKERGRNSLVSKGLAQSITVPMVTLSSLLQDCAVDAGDVGFIWLDLEGYEFEVMQQVVRDLPPHVPVFTEFSPGIYGAEKTAAFLTLLQEHYARCYVLRDADVEGPLALSSWQPDPAEQVDVLLLNPGG